MCFDTAGGLGCELREERGHEDAMHPVMCTGAGVFDLKADRRGLTKAMIRFVTLATIRS